MEVQGRNRYYRIADERVVQAVEALARIAPRTPVRSLREGTRANALRRSRLCYDHLAGSLGVALMGSLIGSGALEGGDGKHHAHFGTDRLSAPGHDVDYHLTAGGERLLTVFGIDLEPVRSRRRPFLRYCMDWTEQAHHLAGGLGAAVTGQLFELHWIRRAPTHRAVRLTDAGREGMRDTFGIAIDDDAMATYASH